MKKPPDDGKTNPFEMAFEKKNPKHKVKTPLAIAAHKKLMKKKHSGFQPGVKGVNPFAKKGPVPPNSFFGRGG